MARGTSRDRWTRSPCSTERSQPRRCAHFLALQLPCAGDATADNQVDVADLIAVIVNWGGSDPDADVNDDGVVDVGDLIAVIQHWGPCPCAG